MPATLLPRPRVVRLDGKARVTPGDPRVVHDASVPAQGYRLRIDAGGDVVIGTSDEAGEFYAKATLAQLQRRSPDATVPVGEIEDHPDLAVRGVMLDVSRCKVPTMETLFALVERLAAWKVNHFELYLEHTFAYPGHDVVWEEADPFTADELARLAAHCELHHITLVANQNCLGHMERWLLHDRYASLGIVRKVHRGPFGLALAPCTLEPRSPGASALVEELLETIGAVVGGAMLHVGLDEPWDLPAQRAGDWRMWLDHVRAMAATAGRELLVWGDMVATHPELLDRWPHDVTVCEWGYESDHPFGARTALLEQRGIPHWVCPGTSSWMTVIGRTTNAIDNCRSAASAARAHGARGLLVTDWGDWGHLQPGAVSDPGFAAGAAMAWCLDTNGDLDAPAIAAALDADVYGDPAGALGNAVVALGDAHRHQPCVIPNLSPLVLHMYLPQMPAGTALDPGHTA
ncbi:MAG: glycoside hydrolase family 20 zincin-like fold domain-containing protein [Acidimicrobiales bacterium]